MASSTRSGEASADSESPDFVPSVFACTDQPPKSQTHLPSFQKKRNLDENTLPVEKRRDIRVVASQPAVTKAPASTPAPASEVMKKRKINDSNETLLRKPSKAPNTGEPVLHPVKTFSKAEIQQLIKQEILAAVQQSEHKMDELIKRIQRTDSVSKYEAVIIRLQPLCSRDSQICVLDPPSPAEPPPAEPRVTGSPASLPSSRIIANGDQIPELSIVEDSDMDGEVVFCGVRLPRKRIVEGFWQRRLKTNRVVDLTEDTEMDTDKGPNSGSNSDPNLSQNGDPTSQNQDSMETVEQEAVPVTDSGRATDPVQVQRQMPTLGPPNSPPSAAASEKVPSSQNCPVSAARAANDNHTTSREAPSPPQSDTLPRATVDAPASTLSSVEDNWRSRLPPLPPTPRPAQLPPAAARSVPPQQVALTVARIKNPKGIGALWTLERPDPGAAAVSRYHIYAMQEALNGRCSAWRNVGTVQAMPLPMACKLTDHGPGRRFCFAVVSEDVYGRFGPYSHIQAIGPQD